MFWVHVYLGMPGPHQGQNRVSDPLEAELQVAVRHYVGAGNPT